MFCIRMAGFTVRFHNRYDLLRRQCEDFVIEDIPEPDFDVPPLSAAILQQRWLIQGDPAREITDPAKKEADLTPLFCLYPRLPEKDAFWIHAVALEMDGAGYALTATSGYGKTTQGRNWLLQYPQARIINGDEPVVRRLAGEYRIYGTPFCGEEGYHARADVPLHGVCWLEHGDCNRLERLEPVQAFAACVRDYQNMGTLTAANCGKYMDLLEEFFEQVPAYILTCTPAPAAAVTACEGMQAGWKDFQREIQERGRSDAD